MRSRLLLSVAPLPTIRETSEEMPPADPGQDPLPSPSLEDYMRSICQLAQPTTVLDKVCPQGERSPASSPQEGSTIFSHPQPTLPSAGADPLDWLFRVSQEKRSGTDLPWTAAPSARPWSGQRQEDSSRARTHRRYLGAPSQQGRQGSSMQSRTSLASRYSPRPSSILRTLCSQLPVIHEL